MGYLLEPSPGSKRNQMFLMGDGGKIPNQGQTNLRLADTNSGNEISLVFRIAADTRPLMSVGKVCDEGKTVTFDKNEAKVMNKEGKEVCTFHRQSGGLYVAKLKLKAPGFARQ